MYNLIRTVPGFAVWIIVDNIVLWDWYVMLEPNELLQKVFEAVRESTKIVF